MRRGIGTTAIAAHRPATYVRSLRSHHSFPSGRLLSSIPLESAPQAGWHTVSGVVLSWLNHCPELMKIIISFICSEVVLLHYCIVLYGIAWYCIVLHFIVLHFIVLHCIALYCIALYCIVLYCIVLYWNIVVLKWWSDSIIIIIIIIINISIITIIIIIIAHDNCNTVEPDLIATEMLVFPSKSSRNKNDSNSTNEKTTPTYGINGIISIANSNNSDHFSLLVLQPLDRRYQIRFHSIISIILFIMMIIYYYYDLFYRRRQVLPDFLWKLELDVCERQL